MQTWFTFDYEIDRQIKSRMSSRRRFRIIHLQEDFVESNKKSKVRTFKNLISIFMEGGRSIYKKNHDEISKIMKCK